MPLTQEMRDALAAPFPPEAIGYKPVYTCRACEGRVCVVHDKAPCTVCNQVISTEHDHVTFIGHAYVTERLFDVDPDWDWEPYAHGPDGLPAFDEVGGLWIRLYIGGEWRKGYGHADGRKDGDGKLIAMGHALRIAGMRGFKIALDHWKGDRRTGPVEPDAVGELPGESDERAAKRLREEAKRLGHRKGLSFFPMVARFNQWANGSADFGTADPVVLRGFLQHLEKT